VKNLYFCEEITGRVRRWPWPESKEFTSDPPANKFSHFSRLHIIRVLPGMWNNKKKKNQRNKEQSTFFKDNNTGNVRITRHWGAFANYFCRRKAINSTHLPVRARGYVRACVRAGGRAGARTAERASACACVHVALLIQHAMSMRHTVTSFLSALASPYFPTLSNKRHDFRKQVIEHKMCVLIFSNTFLILEII
jgi:hypothetical protein